jgi:capsular polysaccharide biosynthesis protein
MSQGLMTQYDKSQGQFHKTGSSVTYNSESHNSQVRLLRDGQRIVGSHNSTIGNAVMGVLEVIIDLR